MKCYIVTVETNTETSRDRVRNVLKESPGYCPIHHYCWAILTEDKAAEVRTKVQAVLDTSERIFVVRSGTEAAWFNAYGEKNTEWLKRNL